MDSVGKGENVHEQVINREQKQTKPSRLHLSCILQTSERCGHWTSIKTVIGKREELLWIKFEKSFNKQQTSIHELIQYNTVF